LNLGQGSEAANRLRQNKYRVQWGASQLPGRKKNLLLALALLGLFLLIFSLSASRSIRAEIIHDEHQFVASGEMLAGHGLSAATLPYRDYPYFHLPNLVFVYGLIYQFTEYKLLAARLFSALTITALAALLYLFSLDSFKDLSTTAGHWVGAGAAMFLVANPLVAVTGSYAWNHNLALLLAVLAFKLHWQGAVRHRPGWWIFSSGICLGLAIGTRLSFASALLPFAVVLYFYPHDRNARAFFKRLSIFASGVFVSFLPVLLLFALAPQQFIFGNFIYPHLNTFYREEAGFFGPPNPMTGGEKLAYFWDFILPQPGNLLTFIALLGLGFTPLLLELWQKKDRLFQSVFLLLLAPLVAWGALLPTPAWYQYYAAPVPFAILSVVYGLALIIRRHPPVRVWVLAIFLQLVILANLFQSSDYRRISFLLHPDTWRPLMIHDLGVRVAELGAGENVLTLAPIYPLEGGASIYPEFSTGPFAWRVAPLVEPERRAGLGLISGEELERFLEPHPPDAILVGFEGELEHAINDYALRHDYRWLELDLEIAVWLPPN
jgi:4-amino-4-deoxy-L-arabinose transferase-like glycosyltransferase